MTTLVEISDLCRAYAIARDARDEVVEQIRDDRRAAVRRRLRVLKTRVAEVSSAEDALRSAVAGAPGLFVRPRTRAIDGIKVGFRKQPGRFEVADEARAIKRVRERLPGREDEIVRVKESLDRAALKRLDARELASIGVTVVETDDEVVVAAVATDLDKLADALFDDVEAEEPAPKRGVPAVG